jgi:hypothetical protein
MEVGGRTNDQATAILAAWKKNEVIFEGNYLSPKRRNRETGRIFVNQARAMMMRQGQFGELEA